MDFVTLGTAVQSVTNVLSIIKQVKDLLPSGKEKQAIEEKIVEAENAFRLAEARVAKEFNYNFCQCTSPIPQIMLSKGYVGRQENFECPRCNKSSIKPQQSPLNSNTFESKWVTDRR